MKGPLAVALLLFLAAEPLSSADVQGTKHDLAQPSFGGDQGTCKPCHGLHRPEAAQGPKWSGRDPKTVFLHIDSPTVDAYIGKSAPAADGVSLACLGCHDGTIAAAALSHVKPGLVGPRSPREIDLSGSHPISFVYSEELVARNNAKDSLLRSPAEVRAQGLLDKQGKVQCTSCHDPHDDTNEKRSGIPFFRRPDFSAMCAACHWF